MRRAIAAKKEPRSSCPRGPSSRALLTASAPCSPLPTPQHPRRDRQGGRRRRPVVAFAPRALVPKLPPRLDLPIVLLDESRLAPTADDDPRILCTIADMITAHPDPDPIPHPMRELVCQDDPATLLYSSGTTGASKGVGSTIIYGLAAFTTGLLGRDPPLSCSPSL
uniref:AMP-dependent synthetase/ligase domain-containing protein n=1 Tax=Ananas comosus var. bracteatus TaxID=296719 RepID=A0A6V7NFM4_ANACO|nr:unnamed protein product [Ananas comosus var. bracteatus]